MKEIRILHIIDDKKFIDNCKITFNIENVNSYFLNSGCVNQAYLNTNKIDILIIHYLKTYEVNFINSSKITIPVCWFFWGADGFSLGKFYNKFLLPKTKRLKLTLAFESGFLNGLKEILKRCLTSVLDFQSHNRNLIQSFSKIDWIIPVVPGDYYLLKKNYNLKSKLFHINYVNPFFKKEYDGVNGKNILLGNSADYPNNHIEILDQLAKIDLGSRKVIIPLSYGYVNYARYIKKYAENKIPENNLCLTEYLEFDEYNKILSGCEIVVMNHLRQQATGNIGFALYIGASVYLRTSTTVYEYLKCNGFHLFDIADLPGLMTLSANEQLDNKMMCKELFGEEITHQKINSLLAMAGLGI